MYGRPQFRSEFRSFCSSHSITHELYSPYNPESNGQAEAAVKSLKSIVTWCTQLEEHAIVAWRITSRQDFSSQTTTARTASTRGTTGSTEMWTPRPGQTDTGCWDAAQFMPTSSSSATSHAVAVTPHQSHTEAIRRKKPKHQIILRLTRRSQGSALPVYMLTNPCLSNPSTPDHQVLHLIMYSV